MEMITAVLAVRSPQPFLYAFREFGEQFGGDRFGSRRIHQGLGALRIDLRLIACGFQSGDAVGEIRIIEVCRSALDGSIETRQPLLGFGSLAA
ncbi:hypothetical protein [Sphingopyxis granuli]|uniref:hypothetical protein n=1 Tax=Sphingopyxis granuli TaxID=267128 RepID=UPI001F38712A|nr:hypothetical protein [Sphingopyxis granuli]